MNNIKITLGQINTTPGDFYGNYRQILAGIKKAIYDDSNMVVFPELSIPGYLTADLMYNKKYVDKNLEVLHEIINYSKDVKPYIVVGYINHNLSGIGKPFTNSLAVIKNGKLIGTYNKRLLPFYDVFDEGRYYEPGTETLVINLNGNKIGFCICEDLWNDKGIENYSYDDNPAKIYRDDLKVDFLVSINSSPYHIGKRDIRTKMLHQIQESDSNEDTYMGIIYVNQQGGQDELIFDGNSCVLSSENTFILPIEDHTQPTFKTITVNTKRIVSPEIEPILPENYEQDKIIKDLLVMGIKDYVNKTGFSQVVLGSSGGVDSALVAALACEALGRNNVHCIMMPSAHSSKGSVEDAKALHKLLGCHEYLVPINHQSSIQHIMNHIPNNFGIYNNVADENIQARLRGMIVMHFSNAYGALPLATSNKTESAVGYFTLYGDSCGGFAPIKDLYKSRVYSLAKMMNVPEQIINKAPSAELAPDQTDEKSLLPYPVLDNIVRLYIEQFIDNYEDYESYYKKYMTLYPGGKTDQYANKADYCKIIRLINNSEFKRRQTAPGIKISSKAFGTGRRLPIAAKHQCE